MTPQDPSHLPPFDYWHQFFGPGANGTICHWSFTPTGVQSPVICEAPYQPVGTAIITPTYTPGPTTPTIPEEPPYVPPGVVVTPEPASLILFGAGALAVFVARRWRK